MDKKKLFFVILCVCLSLGVIGATYAYFTAKAVDENTVTGNASTVSFGLKVEKVTTVDMAFGLVPMKNNQAPGAAYNKCYDDNGNAGCQLYRITVDADSDTVMFLDGYVVTTPKEGVETRVASVYSDDEEENFYTKFVPDDFIDDEHLKDDFISSNDLNDQGIKTGMCEKKEGNVSFNHTDDSDCFLINNKQIGGDSGRKKVFYIMIWVFDNGETQDFMQGMELAYQGSITFVTAEGNEITATFD